ncbi:hypothetical protein SDC9_211472 [bioreactor metagenome]|uniref:CBM-cenC domain-containing protein n=1 Tax=bioreactor metagenome TaxID=1076179 RepID=A0A645JK23_9ZZZZ
MQDAVAVQPIPLKELQNKDLTITVKSKVNKFHKGALASISLRFENNEGNFLSFLKKDSIVSDKWQEYSISGKVPANATSGLIILAFRGYGEAFFDDVKVTYKDKKSIKSLTVNNPSFEQVLQFNNSNWMTTNETYSNGYMLDYSFNESVDGKQS